VATLPPLLGLHRWQATAPSISSSSAANLHVSYRLQITRG
jgi:hypothetical protein